MKKLIICFILITLNISCNTTEPPLPDGDRPTLTLTLEDVSCTEAWIKLSTTDLSLPTNITLSKISNVTDTINLVSADTLLYIDSLLPNNSYTYQVSSIKYQVSSNKLPVTTLDTTSHNRTWQVFKFGEHQHSVLYDVAIIDENNIWAVGEIYLLDSLGNDDPHAYNAVHWDGNAWTLFRIMFYTICGQQSRTPYPAKSIYIVDESEIWIAGGGRQLAKLDGIVQTNTFCPPFSIIINSIWGQETRNLSVVGNNGKVGYFQNSSWSQLESGTEVDLFDIWESNDGTLWTCGYSNDYGTTALLRFSGTSWKTVYEGSGNNQSNGYYIGPISGVWGTNNYRIYMMNWGGIRTGKQQ